MCLQTGIYREEKMPPHMSDLCQYVEEKVNLEMLAGKFSRMKKVERQEEEMTINRKWVNTPCYIHIKML